MSVSELRSAWSTDITLRFGHGTACLQQLQELLQTCFGAMCHADAVEVPNSVFLNESWIKTAQLRACPLKKSAKLQV
jgi:hypothetical protein